MVLRRIIAPFAALLVSGSATALDQPFIDRFASIDSTRWRVSDGWRNGDYMVNDWRASQVRSGPGLLLSLSRRQDGGYSSAEVQSRAAHGYGYYEAELRAATGEGIVTGFFTYTGPPQGKPWNEIDVEILGRNTRRVQLTYFHGPSSVPQTVDLPFDAAAGAHRYGFDWRRNGIRWYVDGKLVATARGDKLPLPDERQLIIMNLWGSRTLSDWLGRFPETIRGVTAKVNCVAYSPTLPQAPLC